MYMYIYNKYIVILLYIHIHIYIYYIHYNYKKSKTFYIPQYDPKTHKFINNRSSSITKQIKIITINTIK